MGVCTGIRGPQWMNPNNHGDPLNFHFAPPAGQSFHLSSKISQYLLDGLAQYSVQICIVHRGCNLMTLVIP